METTSMRAEFLIGVMIIAANGCTHYQLQRSTIRQVSTITDLQYKQVLDNLAMLSANPGALPYFAVTNGGTAQITDGGSVAPGFEFSPFKSSLGLEGRREISENWTLVPITDPDKLGLMQCTYQFILQSPSPGCDNCYPLLCDYFGPDLLCYLPTGWFCTGGKKDVPCDACYVGCYCNQYVWVTADGVAGLSRFTRSILDIATGTLHTHAAEVVRKFEGNKLVSTEVKTIEANSVLLNPTVIPRKTVDTEGTSTSSEPQKTVSPEVKTVPEFQIPAAPRQRIEFHDPYRGLLSLPRGR